MLKLMIVNYLQVLLITLFISEVKHRLIVQREKLSQHIAY